ncbi:hypothetical protein BU23DRAFT_557381 [Bimuria novae-zelandiae CBS 107.79]|uniref:Uncharacterized protein n=1 Tax=Bimuria novae-zelandiae CBS 107.79 TaxID=1447943 RepID=A0A6A5V8X0_9PLEO|nr:hypothetical protein BU23DRAFT_557381 [Bimuria novae-zelandiae CBS 107.79]
MYRADRRIKVALCYVRVPISAQLTLFEANHFKDSLYASSPNLPSMRNRLRASGFSHSRSFSAPTVPSLRLTPPTPHGSFHPTDYDSDDSIPSSAAAMPRPNRYRRHATRNSSHPYAPSSGSSSSPTFPPEQCQQINPGYFSGTCAGAKIAAFSIVLSPDGEVNIRGQLLPSQYPSQTYQERKSLSQPSSPLFFQAPIDPQIAALGIQNPPTTMADGTVEAQQGNTTATRQQEHVLPFVNHHAGQTDVFINPYAEFQQSMPMWPVEQIPPHSRPSSQ